MEPNSSPASPEPVAPVTPPADDKPNYQTRDDLDFEMTAEEEKSYVDEILKTGANSDVPTEPEKEVVTPPAPVAPEIPPVTPPVVPPVVEPEKPVEPKVTEPIKTDDLFIEVEQVTTDDLDDEKVEKIKLVYNPANPKAFVPDDFVAKNSKQLADILEAKQEMASLYNERKEAFDKVESGKVSDQADQARLQGWDNEIKDLIDSGILETPKVEKTDPKYAEDPAVVKTEAVFGFMADENKKRSESGTPLITSFGTAFTLYTNSETVKAEAEAKAKEIADTKAKGALIGGGTPSSSGTVEPKAYKAGSARNIWDVPVEQSPKITIVISNRLCFNGLNSSSAFWRAFFNKKT